MSLDENTPVLIGVGQVTVRDEPLDKLSRPIDLMEVSARLAAEDAQLTPSSLAEIDKLVVVTSFFEPMRNSPARLATRLGAAETRTWLTPHGGAAPQYLVNRFAEEIAEERAKLVLLTGAEAADNVRRLVKSGQEVDWSEPCDSDAELLFPDREMSTQHEQSHGIWEGTAGQVYPLLETALRGHYGSSIEKHQLEMGELFARFSEVAAKSPYAWFPQARSAEEIARADAHNRYVGWPYTKFMNAMNQVNQGAALLMTSVRRARQLGVPEDRWVHLHGTADTTEIWNFSDRVDYASSPAIRMLGERAFAMAERTIDEIDLIDIYSCFPSAVEISRDSLGISRDDPRPLTVTGGLPFHGGAGNNYSMNAIATMADRLRASRGKFGLVTANGGILSKNAAGIYSTTPTARAWRREDPSTYQPLVDGLAHPALVETPDGDGVIETYTVSFDRSGEPTLGIVVGRLGNGDDPMAPRFIANTPDDRELNLAMTKEDFLGARGRVTSADGLNTFAPAD